LLGEIHQILLILARRRAQKPSIIQLQCVNYGGKKVLARDGFCKKNLGFGVGFGYHNNSKNYSLGHLKGQAYILALSFFHQNSHLSDELRMMNLLLTFVAQVLLYNARNIFGRTSTSFSRGKIIKICNNILK